MFDSHICFNVRGDDLHLVLSLFADSCSEYNKKVDVLLFVGQTVLVGVVSHSDDQVPQLPQVNMCPQTCKNLVVDFTLDPHSGDVMLHC